MPLCSPFTLHIRGRLLEVTRPLVMGIINATPDSFYASSRSQTTKELTAKTEKMIEEGADIIDLGAYSSRPGAYNVTSDEELRRLQIAMNAIRNASQEIPVSIDTFRADIAQRAIDYMGADMINDISAGMLDDKMLPTIARLNVPYVAMHMRGTPETMQNQCNYPHGVVQGVIAELQPRIRQMEQLGISDVIIDPGFGFSKTLEQNYEVFSQLPMIEQFFGKPLLVGISRKSMLTRLLGIEASEALNATTALNFAAIERGAAIIRVHDVAPARQAITIATALLKTKPQS